MLSSLIKSDPSDGYHFDSTPAALAEIYQPSVNLAVWKRSLSSEISDYVQWLMHNTSISGIRSVVPLHEVKNEVLSGLPEYAGQESFADDVYLLAAMYIDLFDLDRIGMRLTILDKTMCPRFHIDKLPCRLISTYIGSGTEWLPNDGVDRRKLGHGAGGLPDKVSGIFSHSDSIQQLNVGDVALMKGAGWDGFEDTAIVHRSPELSVGEKRLILSLDFAD